jgi:capsular polysaccharide export protein
LRRSFLFLQGPSTPFFARLADRVAAAGHAVQRIGFCGGDMLYWGRRQALRYGGPVAGLAGFLDGVYRRCAITDQVLFGDCRPVHRPALERGRVAGVRTHVFEGGYFRPWWVTLERDGVNGMSRLPRDAGWYRATAARLGEPAEPVRFTPAFREHAFHYVAYHLATPANWLWFRGYRRHLPFSVVSEHLGFMRRFARLRLIGERERARARAIAAAARPYFVLPLQTNADAQIVHHSGFAHMGEVIEQVLESFARHAPQGSVLVVKNHPLDEGLMDYPQIIGRCQARLGLAGRVEYLEDGDFGLLAQHARGVVTVNSTAGLAALELGTPVLSLSEPVYDLPGLTSGGPLDDFWRTPAPPDATLYASFRRVVMHATQVNGGFYCRQGIALAAENAAGVLTAERSRLEGLL